MKHVIVVLIILNVRLFNSMSTGRQNKAQHDASRIPNIMYIVANNNSDNDKQTNSKYTKTTNEKEKNISKREHHRVHTVGVVIYLFDYYIVYFHVLDRKFSIYTIDRETPSVPITLTAHITLLICVHCAFHLVWLS